MVTLFIALAGLAVGLCALWGMRSLSTMRKTFFAGNKGADLENVISLLSAKLSTLSDEHAALEKELSELQRQLLQSIKKVGVVRFNPFADTGGNFSFTIALLNSEDSGVVITSIHGRQQNRVYAKHVIQGGGQTPLTEEERQAIATANSMPTQK